ncbi:response regulator transcription factor [Leucothrix arctica]|uniref:DNA-binding response regulator n=1 Tax=Leucothrix arctica TaxID=1481894 RepID=A0A317CER4_9GAMM|nr:response regulator transcription factor [Leucothrix arctica]PWQ96839.1 DNA-binding response regulator [Leucothrix arctica]
MHILLVEDDQKLADYIKQGLLSAGHTVDHISDGSIALAASVTESYDVGVIDRMIPGVDGLSLVKAMRSANLALPVLFLTSLGGVDDRVDGLEAGGDDYLTKPFAFPELLARVAALGRRPPIQGEELTLSYADIVMNVAERKVLRAGTVLDLLPKEYKILEIFIRNPGRVITKNMLLEKVWDIHFDPKTSVVETHISRLRDKLDKPFDSQLLKTVRGAGYKLEVS